MRYNPLGTTGWNVSKLCLGTMTFGQQNDEAEGHAQLDYALEHGINFIDTAELYSVPARAETQGSTERIIGSWIAARGGRDRYHLATKIAGPAGFTKHIRQPLGFGRPMLEDALGKSLDRLQTDYIDLYQLHWPERRTNYFGVRGVDSVSDDEWEDNFLQLLHDMQDLIQSGRIRAWGVSNESPWGLMRLLYLADAHGLPRPVTVQNPYALLNRSYEVGLAEISLRENVPLIPYSPLGMGQLTGKYIRGEDKPENRLNQFPNYKRYSQDNAVAATRAYAEVAQRHGLSLTALSLAFVNDRDFVASTIIGATDLEQLAENLASIDVRLDDGIIEELDEVRERFVDPSV